VPQNGWRHRPVQILDILQRLKHPEARPDAGVIDDEIELRPVGSCLHEVVWVSVIWQVVRPARLRSIRRKALVDANVKEPRMFSELGFVLSDDCIGRVGDLLVVQAPHRKLRSGRVAGCERYIIALPRVRLTELNLPLCVVAKCRIGEVPGPGINLSMSESPPRA